MSKEKESLADKIKRVVESQVEYMDDHADKIRAEREQRCRENKSCLTYWFPVVSRLTGILTPKTFIYPIHFEDQLKMLNVELTNKTVNALDRIKADAKLFGYPVFIKNSLFSGKHDWMRTCFVQEEGQIEANLRSITDFAYSVGCEESMFWILREYISPMALFTAHNGMPVSKERRYFIEDGDVVFHHPYWPPESIENASCSNWMEKLNEMNEETDDEILLLKNLTKKVARALPGSWSVDWMQSSSGKWYLIDMAETGKSFMWKEYNEGKKGL